MHSLGGHYRESEGETTVQARPGAEIMRRMDLIPAIVVERWIIHLSLKKWMCAIPGEDLYTGSPRPTDGTALRVAAGVDLFEASHRFGCGGRRICIIEL